MLLSFNEKRYDPSTVQIVYKDYHDLNFLILGYRIQPVRSLFSAIEVSAQAKNLLLREFPKTPGYASRYFGLGLSAAF
jgi:hypothetical protein